MLSLKKLFLFIFLPLFVCSCFSAPPEKPMDGDFQRAKATYESALYPSFMIVNPEDGSSGSGVIFYSKNGITLGLTCTHVLGSFYPVGYFYNTKDIGQYIPIPLHVLECNFEYDISVIELLTDKQMHAASMYKTTEEFRKNVFIFEQVVGVGSGLKDRPSPILGIWSYFECPKRAAFAGASITIAPGDSGGGLFEANTMKLIGIMRAISSYKGQFVYHKASIIPYNTVRECLIHSMSVKVLKAVKDLGWKRE